MKRPTGSVGVSKTFKVSKKIRGAEVSAPGLGRALVAVVKVSKYRYVVAAPKELGGAKSVPADSFTDALHWTVSQMNTKAKREAKGKKR